MENGNQDTAGSQRRPNSPQAVTGGNHGGAASSPASEPGHSRRANWQLPAGVSQGTWDYVRNQSIATGYENFLNGDPLTVADWAVVDQYLPPQPVEDLPQTVIEFGCGNGRTLIKLMENGYRCVGVDLSVAMLTEMHRKWNGAPQQLVSAQANLVELDGIGDNSVDHAVCLFSTLGMIRGTAHRKQFLDHARRIVRPSGYFLLHAHHVWHQLTHRGGVSWCAKHLLDVAKGKMEFGDRFAVYRGIRNMYIHSFRKSKFERLLTDAGFQIEAWHSVTPAVLQAASQQPAGDALLESMRAERPTGLSTVGWIVVCR